MVCHSRRANWRVAKYSTVQHCTVRVVVLQYNMAHGPWPMARGRFAYLTPTIVLTVCATCLLPMGAWSWPLREANMEGSVAPVRRDPSRRAGFLTGVDLMSGGGCSTRKSMLRRTLGKWSIGLHITCWPAVVVLHVRATLDSCMLFIVASLHACHCVSVALVMLHVASYVQYCVASSCLVLLLFYFS